MKTWSISLLVFFLAFTGCKTKAPSNASNTPDSGSGSVACRSLEEGNEFQRDNLMGLKAEPVDGCLKVSATYGGGCQPHDFGLHWNGKMTKSLPPQTTVFLSHDSHDDNCRAVKTDTETFDLAPIFEAGGYEVRLTVVASGVEPVTLLLGN